MPGPFLPGLQRNLTEDEKAMMPLLTVIAGKLDTAQIRKDADRARDALTSLTNQCNDDRKIMLSLQNQCIDDRKTINSLQNQLFEDRKTTSEHKEEMVSLQHAVKALQSRCDESNTAIAKLQTDIIKDRTIIDELRNTNRELTESNAKLSNANDAIVNSNKHVVLDVQELAKKLEKTYDDRLRYFEQSHANTKANLKNLEQSFELLARKVDSDPSPSPDPEHIEDPAQGQRGPRSSMDPLHEVVSSGLIVGMPPPREIFESHRLRYHKDANNAQRGLGSSMDPSQEIVGMPPPHQISKLHRQEQEQDANQAQRFNLGGPTSSNRRGHSTVDEEMPGPRKVRRVQKPNQDQDEPSHAIATMSNARLGRGMPQPRGVQDPSLPKPQEPNQEPNQEPLSDRFTALKRHYEAFKAEYRESGASNQRAFTWRFIEGSGDQGFCVWVQQLLLEKLPNLVKARKPEARHPGRLISLDTKLKWDHIRQAMSGAEPTFL